MGNSFAGKIGEMLARSKNYVNNAAIGEVTLNRQPAALRLLSCLNVKLRETGSEMAKYFN
jgi:hypothetical protein